jgi:5-methylcytosine-specific restriction enzyme subunit McrC
MLIKKSMSNVIQAFEYTCLGVGQECFTRAHFEQLVRYNERFGNKFFDVGNNRIYFKNYVGVFQVGNLVIEILPKADKVDIPVEDSKNRWHNALISMLRLSGYLKIDAISRTDLRLQKRTLIDLYYQAFIDEVQDIIHGGMTKRYRHVIENLPYLKGRLVFNKHIAENYLHKENFFTEHQVYDNNNVFNRILKKALLTLKDISKQSLLHGEICDLLLSLDKIDDIKITDGLFERLIFNRNTEKYRTVITLARMILQNYSPDVHKGENNVIGILFDMNRLFEKVVFRVLKNSGVKYHGLKLVDQRQKKFWKDKVIKPDIYGEITTGDERQAFIVDTKWKLPGDSLPNDNDLKQMFTYNAHFGAKLSVLVYPDTKASMESMSEKFRESELIKTEHRCSTFFINLFIDKEGNLNKDAGDDLIKFIKNELRK